MFSFKNLFKRCTPPRKLKSNKKGQGSLIAIILASVIGTIIISSTTQWFLSMNKTMDGTNDRLEAMTIAMSEWQRLEHMSLDELEANRENYKTPYKVGDNFTVGVNLGEQGFFDNGKCNSLTGTYAGENANCFKDTTMTVYDKDGKAMYTTRSLPLSVSRDSFPEGTILPYTGDLAKIPHGWVLCDGNNGTPDLTGRFLEGTKTSTGVFKMAGLPNITGKINAETGFRSYGEGALDKFYLNDDGGYWGPGGSNWQGVSFDASKSNPIYGSSDTVQPPSYTVFYIMKTNTDFHYNHTNPVDAPSFYTKAEIDSMFSSTKNYYNNTIGTLTGRLDGNEFIKNRTVSYTLNLGYEKKDGDEEYKLYAYNGETEIPFAFKSNDLFNTNGYTILPNGLIMQWGYISGSTRNGWGNIATNVVFPIPFKNTPLNVHITSAGRTASSHYDTDAWANIGVIDKNHFEAHLDSYIGNTETGHNFYWFAIGY